MTTAVGDSDWKGVSTLICAIFRKGDQAWIEDISRIDGIASESNWILVAKGAGYSDIIIKISPGADLSGGKQPLVY
ncbi:hypothetical protein D1AOALGA4SA_2065 [Olavius algarvensis Delta 1 endosymbiont]|nr:hypothetical protein D1AOALGA4SA_2065 [Olavius algarvensis Delta 1 endosymbiont]